MTELSVEPKKRRSILPWILLGLGIIALIWFLATRNKDDDNEAAASTTGSTTQSSATNEARSGWDGIDMNAPAVNYDEITDRNINVRGGDNYAIYGLGENLLFDENQATLRADAEANLKQITASINKRYNGGQVRVYGYTDAQGSAGYNKELAEQRANAVKAWMQANGVDAGRISVNAIGEGQPVASNNTEAGRQENRRVEIAAKAQ